ncbi:MAG: hypothetical protein GY725_11585 [bacterium]|nr:hypothetical protein [bacterium]
MSDENPLNELTPEEAAFVERLRGGYTPEPMSPARRVTFREELDARLTRRTLGWRAPLGAVLAASAALALWFAVPNVIEQPGLGAPLSETASAQSIEEVLLTLSASALDETESDNAELPDDYAAIASLLLDGV